MRTRRRSGCTAYWTLYHCRGVDVVGTTEGTRHVLSAVAGIGKCSRRGPRIVIRGSHVACERHVSCVL